MSALHRILEGTVRLESSRLGPMPVRRLLEFDGLTPYDATGMQLYVATAFVHRPALTAALPSLLSYISQAPRLREALTEGRLGADYLSLGGVLDSQMYALMLMAALIDVGRAQLMTAATWHPDLPEDVVQARAFRGELLIFGVRLDPTPH